MKPKNKSFLLFLLLFLVVAMAGRMQAVGIAPAQETVDFEPSLTKQVDLRVINPEGESRKILVYPKGPMAEHISFNRTLYVFEQGENEKEFTYNVTFPDEMDTPGIHTTKIVAMVLPEDAKDSVVVADDSQVVYQSEQSKSVVQATTAVASKLNVFVPYPGKYAEGKLIIEEAMVNEDVGFRIPVYSYGNKTINNMSATIEIRGPTNEVIGRTSTQSISVAPKQEEDLFATWEASVNRGVYHAVVSVKYADKRFTLEKNFYVGNMRVEVVDIMVPHFSLGDIAKFEITMENKWNKIVKDIHANLHVMDENGVEFADFKTEDFAIEAQERKTVDAFWDTQGVDPGTYDMKVDVHYEGKTTEKMFNAQVNLDSIQTDFTPVAKAVSNEGDGDDNMLLIIVIAVLLGVNIFWFLYFKKRSAPPRGKEGE